MASKPVKARITSIELLKNPASERCKIAILVAPENNGKLRHDQLAGILVFNIAGGDAVMVDSFVGTSQFAKLKNETARKHGKNTPVIGVFNLPEPSYRSIFSLAKG
jgi:hypothetical protein